MRHMAWLAAVLAALWLLLSGYFQPLLLSFGALSVGLVAWIAWRMDRADGEPQPIEIRFGRWLAYLGWLAVQVVRSNIDVARRILHPRLPVSPVLFRVPASQRTRLGRVIYANSITLTPGTVSVDLRDGQVLVHALTREGEAELERGEMDRRVTALERVG